MLHSLCILCPAHSSLQVSDVTPVFAVQDSLTQEASHLLPRFGHVHLQDEVGVGGEAEQRAFLSPELHQLLQDDRVLLKTRRTHLFSSLM